MEKEFKELVSALKETKRRNFIRDFALTGALALSALTQPRATRGIRFSFFQQTMAQKSHQYLAHL